MELGVVVVVVVGAHVAQLVHLLAVLVLHSGFLQEEEPDLVEELRAGQDDVEDDGGQNGLEDLGPI
jgi:hypothetical protein